MHFITHADYLQCWNGHTLFSKRSWKIGNLSNCTSYLLDPWPVTCSVWRSFLCFQIIKLSQTLPLPRLSHRMPCCLTSVPVGNTYTTNAAKCFALSAYIQFINVNHCPLKWDGLFCLHPAFLHYGICGRRAFLPRFIVHGGINPMKHSKLGDLILEVGLQHCTISAAVCWRWGCSTACKATVLRHTVLR